MAKKREGVITGSYGHSAPLYTVYQATLLMHGSGDRSGDMISVINFWSRLWGWLLVSLLFPDNFSHTQPMLILIRYPGSRHHSTPEYTWYQAVVWMHGLGGLISVTNF